MHASIHHVLSFFVHLGAFGLFLLAVGDDSFLFLPVGTDLLLVVLAARHHSQLPVYAVTTAAGSTIGILLLDLVCRNAGEKGLRRIVKPKLLAYLNGKMERHATIALVIACLAPPPFPFGASIAVASALQYPRPRLLGLVFVVRVARYALVGWAAVYFGRGILRIASSADFEWAMGAFIALCVVGSAVSIVSWVRLGNR